MDTERVATLLQLSDTHLTAVPHGLVHGVDSEERLAVVLAAVLSLGTEVDAVILSGDLAEDASREACVRLAEAVSAFGAPVMAVPGNHDDPAAVSDVFGPPKALACGPWRIVGLDTSRPGRVDGEVDRAQAERRLDEAGDNPTVVVLHHPPVSPSTHPWFQLVGADGFLEALETRPNVRVVLTGHLHLAFERRAPGGAALLGGPSTLVSIGHEGNTWEVGAGGPTGARLLHLHDDATWTEELISA